jgi:putative membrane protein
LGGINTAVALFSLISLFTISKARSGAAVAVMSLLPGFGLNELIILVSVALISAGISSLLLVKSARRVISIFERANYRKMTVFVIAFLGLTTIILTGFFGFLVLITSTAIGSLAPLWGVKRSSLMGVLMVPLILFYAGI